MMCSAKGSEFGCGNLKVGRESRYARAASCSLYFSAIDGSVTGVRVSIELYSRFLVGLLASMCGRGLETIRGLAALTSCFVLLTGAVAFEVDSGSSCRVLFLVCILLANSSSNWGGANVASHLHE